MQTSVSPPPDAAVSVKSSKGKKALKESDTKDKKDSLRVVIHYTNLWNLYYKAVSVAEEIKQTLGVTAELKQAETTEDSTFDIIANGKTVFSKELTGRLPSKYEPTFLIKEMLEENKKNK